LATGVPRDQLETWGRVWQLLQDMKAEREAADLAANYTTSDCCPRCGAAPRITGGKINRTYCPKCCVRVTDTRTVKGQRYYRWTPFDS